MLDVSELPSNERDAWTMALSDTSDPEVRLRLLSYRVSVLTREKEDLADRVSKMERSFNMGAGILLVVPILGTLIGILLTFGKHIFRPWIAP